MSVSYSRTLYLTPGTHIPVKINLSQYEYGGILIFDFDTSKLYGSSLANVTNAAIMGTKPDGNGISLDGTWDSTKKTVTVKIIEQMTAVAGRGVYEVQLKDGGGKMYTANFYIDVERAALDKDTITSDSVIRELIDVTDRAEEIVAAAKSIAPAADTVAAAVTAVQAAQEAAEAAQSAAETANTEAQAAAETAVETAANEVVKRIAETAELLEHIDTEIDNAGVQRAKLADAVSAAAMRTAEIQDLYTKTKGYANLVESDLAEVKTWLNLAAGQAGQVLVADGNGGAEWQTIGTAETEEY